MIPSNHVHERDWHDYEGMIVPRHFLAVFVVLSYLVSFMGSWVTLELLGRRTSSKGWFNWYSSIMIAAAISMGGIALWCTHFVGNRAVVLGRGEIEIQIIYNAGYTVLSFFLPILVLLGAFTVAGENDVARPDRLILAGALAILGICGMYFLGRAGIKNYTCWYDVPYMIGSVLVAITAIILAMGTCAMLPSQWRTSWWRRCLRAMIWSIAVSGMYWLASIGTVYQLKEGTWASNTTNSSRSATTAVVIILSIVGCFCLLILSLANEARNRRMGHRSRQIVLTTAKFDQDGKLLVTADGLLPNRKITNSFLERGLDDSFNLYHPAYLWIFRTTRNWGSIIDLVPAMRDHLSRSGLTRRFGPESTYTTDQGSPIENYTIIFRELFCIAAANLAEDLNEPLENLGVLYDDIIPTDQILKVNRFKTYEQQKAEVDLEKDGIELEPLGRGQLLFLVRNVDKEQAKRLQAAGYRFALAEQLVPNLAATFRMRRADLTRCLDIMRTFRGHDYILEPGVHLALFTVRASVAAGGFEILTRKDARNLLPTMQLPLDNIQNWQLEYLQTLDTLTVSLCLKQLYKDARAKNGEEHIKLFAKQLQATLQALKEEINDAEFFNEAKLIAKPMKAPCRGPTKHSRPRLASLISFRLAAAIHSRAPGSKLDYTPLALFKTHQKVYKNSPLHQTLARLTYREFAPTLDLSELISEVDSYKSTAPDTPLSRKEKHTSSDFIIHNITDLLFSKDGLSRLKRRQHMKSPDKYSGGLSPPEQHHFGGILVSRGISVVTNDITEINDEIVTAPSPSQNAEGFWEQGDNPGFQSKQINMAGWEGQVEEEDQEPYVDELFRITILNR